jgi:hypothetical protein
VEKISTAFMTNLLKFIGDLRGACNLGPIIVRQVETQIQLLHLYCQRTKREEEEQERYFYDWFRTRISQ